MILLGCPHSFLSFFLLSFDSIVFFSLVLSSRPCVSKWTELQELNTHKHHSSCLFQEVVAGELHDGTDIVLQRGLQSSWWQPLFTGSRKGNISFSLDTQNATSVGGHRLQTEISSYSCSSGTEGGRQQEERRDGREGDKDRLGGGRRNSTSVKPMKIYLWMK